MRYAAVKFKKWRNHMAEVDYCSEHLNVRKEVKIVFQGKREIFINHVKCILLHFRQRK